MKNNEIKGVSEILLSHVYMFVDSYVRAGRPVTQLPEALRADEPALIESMLKLFGTKEEHDATTARGT